MGDHSHSCQFKGFHKGIWEPSIAIHMKFKKNITFFLSACHFTPQREPLGGTPFQVFQLHMESAKPFRLLFSYPSAMHAFLSRFVVWVQNETNGHFDNEIFIKNRSPQKCWKMVYVQYREYMALSTTVNTRNYFTDYGLSSEIKYLQY